MTEQSIHINYSFTYQNGKIEEHGSKTVNNYGVKTYYLLEGDHYQEVPYEKFKHYKPIAKTTSQHWEFPKLSDQFPSFHINNYCQHLKKIANEELIHLPYPARSVPRFKSPSDSV